MHLRKTSRQNWLVIEASSELVQKHLRSEGMNDEALIEHYIAAATEDVEASINFPIVDCVLSGFRCDFSSFRIPALPTYRTETIEVKYWDATDETLKTLSSENYTIVVSAWICVSFKGALPTLMDRPDAVIVTMSAGFEALSQIPATYIQPILMRAASMYDQRGEYATKYQQASERLVNKIRHHNI